MLPVLQNQMQHMRDERDKIQESMVSFRNDILKFPDLFLKIKDEKERLLSIAELCNVHFFDSEMNRLPIGDDLYIYSTPEDVRDVCDFCAKCFPDRKVMWYDSSDNGTEYPHICIE